MVKPKKSSASRLENEAQRLRDEVIPFFVVWLKACIGVRCGLCKEISQVAFAEAIGLRSEGGRVIRSWERGQNRPRGMARLYQEAIRQVRFFTRDLRLPSRSAAAERPEDYPKVRIAEIEYSLEQLTLLNERTEQLCAAFRKHMPVGEPPTLAGGLNSLLRAITWRAERLKPR